MILKLQQARVGLVVMTVPQKLLVRLSASLGRQAAAQELRWMHDTITKAGTTGINADAELSTLKAMVARRLRGEPLQYILGMSGTKHVICHHLISHCPRPTTLY